VLIPEENAKDLVEIADSIKSGIEIVPVSRMDEVLAWAMTRKPEPIEWNEITTTAAAVPKEAPVEEEAQPMPHGFAAGAGFPGRGPRRRFRLWLWPSVVLRRPFGILSREVMVVAHQPEGRLGGAATCSICASSPLHWASMIWSEACSF
jgi:Lon protease (S16) C-terminal proteolytic domain